MAELSIYEHLMHCIATRDCSLKELAKRAEVPYDTVCKIAQRQTIPRLDTTEKLLRCFPKRKVAA